MFVAVLSNVNAGEIVMLTTEDTEFHRGSCVCLARGSVVNFTEWVWIARLPVGA